MSHAPDYPAYTNPLSAYLDGLDAVEAGDPERAHNAFGQAINMTARNHSLITVQAMAADGLLFEHEAVEARTSAPGAGLSLFESAEDRMTTSLKCLLEVSEANMAAAGSADASSQILLDLDTIHTARRGELTAIAGRVLAGHAIVLASHTDLATMNADTTLRQLRSEAKAMFAQADGALWVTGQYGNAMESALNAMRAARAHGDMPGIRESLSWLNRAGQLAQKSILNGTLSAGEAMKLLVRLYTTEVASLLTRERAERAFFTGCTAMPIEM